MNEQTKKDKNLILENVKKATDSIFKASTMAGATEYTAGTGDVCKEDPGTYCGLLSREIARDMMNAALASSTKDKDVSDGLKDTWQAMFDKDIAIRRMIDDLKDNRPLSEYPYGSSENMVRALLKFKTSNLMEDKYLLTFKPKLDIWVERIGKMDIWAYYLETKQRLNRLKSDASMTAYDDDGNRVYGMPKDNAYSVKILTAMAEILLQALIRLPFRGKESGECMDRVETLCILAELIAKEDEDAIKEMAQKLKITKERS